MAEKWQKPRIVASDETAFEPQDQTAVFDPLGHYPDNRLPGIAQALITGDDFRRREEGVTKGVDEAPVRLYQVRQVQIMGGIDTGQGTIFVEAYDPGRHPTDSDLVRVVLKHPVVGEMRADMEPCDIETIRKHGASRTHHSQAEAIKKRGGDPSATKDIDYETTHGTYFGPPTNKHPRIEKSKLPK